MRRVIALLLLLVAINAVYADKPAWTDTLTPGAVNAFERGEERFIVKLSNRPARAHKGFSKGSACVEEYLSSSTSFAVVNCRGKSLEALAMSGAVEKVYADEMHELQLLGSVPKIQATNVTRDLGYNGSGVVVAIVDSGIFTDHHAMEGRVLAEEDFTIAGTTEDLANHGTGVASVVVSQNTTHTGVAPGAKVLNAKACAILPTGGDGCANSWIMPAVDWAIEQGADVISMSLGSTSSSCANSQLALFVNETIETNNTPFVVAAGNGGPVNGTIYEPACAINTIAVGASADNNVATYSSRGPVDGASGMKPDLLAPGDVTVANNAGLFLPDSGTSYSAPHVSGVIALMLEARPELSGDWKTIKAILKQTALDLGWPYEQQGAGRVDALAAVQESLVRDLRDPFLAWNTGYSTTNPVASKTDFAVEYSALNIGNLNASNVEVELSGFSGPLKVVAGDATQSFGQVDPEELIEPSWTLNSKSSGTWEFTLELRWDGGSESVSWNQTIA